MENTGALVQPSSITENTNNRVKNWKENTVNSVTRKIAPEHFLDFMKNVQESLNLRNSEKLQQLTKDIQDMSKNSDLYKSVEFKDSNSRSVVVFYCSKTKDGTFTVAYAVHSLSYQMESGKSEIGEDENDTVTYQKQEAELRLRQLGFKWKNKSKTDTDTALEYPKFLKVSSKEGAATRQRDKMGKYELQGGVTKGNFPVWKKAEQYLFVAPNGFWSIGSQVKSVGIYNTNKDPTPSSPLLDDGWMYFEGGAMEDSGKMVNKWKTDSTIKVEVFMGNPLFCGCFS